MVVADGDVAISELDEMYRIAREDYGFTPAEINKAVLSGGSALYIPQNNEEKVRYLYDLALIAAADGVIENSEIILLKNYALKFGFLEESVDELVNILLDFAKTKTPIDTIVSIVK